MTANPVRPGRYRPGKAVAEEASSDEEEDEEAGDDVEEAEEVDTTAAATAPKAQPPKFSSGKQAAATASNLRSLNLEERRRRDLERERAAKDEERKERERLEREAGFVTESESGDDASDDEDDDAAPTRSDTARRKAQQSSKQTGSTSEEDSDEDSDSEDESDSSDSDAKPQLKRPIFIKKSDRAAGTSTATQSQQPAAPSTTAKSSQPPPDTAKPTKQAQADALIQATLDARALEAASSARHWDDEGPGDLDDTDGLDPELEHAAWVARELARLKRSRAALEEREAEIAEVERRRALNTPEREREDQERIDEQKAARDEKAKEAKERGTEGYLRRYHHKGAFGAGDEEAEERLRERDLMTAEYEGSVKMKSALPQYLQVRDETSIGRKGRQRHRDLKSEDTGSWGRFEDGRRKRQDGFEGGMGGDERFRPDDPRDRDRTGPTGANAGAVGERKRGGGYGDREDDAKRMRREEVR